MEFFNLDIAIVLIFLGLNLVIGLYFGRGVENIRDYALGGRNFSTTALVSTIVATAVTGSLFITGLSRGYTHGIYDLIPISGYAFSLMLTAWYFIPKMQSFLGDVSIADSMGRNYGDQARIITAVCSIIATLGAIAIQFKVFGTIINYFLGLDAFLAVAVSGTVVTLYSAFGGIRAVTITDVFQFMIFGVVIPLIGVIIWQSIIGNESLSFTKSLSAQQFSVANLVDTSSLEFWEMIFIGLYSITPVMYPELYQRILMGKNLTQVVNAFKMSFWILLFIFIYTGWISFELYTINDSLDPNALVAYIVDNYTYTGLKGAIIIGVMAMAMSSADSFINVCSIMFVHDICKPLNLIKNNNEQLQLKLARTSALVIGFGSIFLAFSGKGLFDIALFANAFYIPVVTAPLLCTILGFRTGRLQVLFAMAVGFITVVIWKLSDIELDPIVPAMFLNFLALMFAHYALRTSGGWEKVAHQLEKTSRKIIFYTDDEAEFYENEATYNKGIFGFFFRNCPETSDSYNKFGLFCFITSISFIYLTQQSAITSYSRVALILFQIMLVLSTSFMLFNLWPRRLIRPLPLAIIWNGAMFYMLSLCNWLFLMLNNFNKIQLAVFTLNTLLLITLNRWKIAVSMLFAGYFVSEELYQIINDASPLVFGFKDEYNLIIYLALVTTAAVTMLIKPEEEYIDSKMEMAKETEIVNYELSSNIQSLSSTNEELEIKMEHYNEKLYNQEKEIARLAATTQKILNNVNHELRLPVGNVVNFAEMIYEGLEQFDKDQLKKLSEEVVKNSTQLSTMILNMLDLAMLDIKKIALDKKVINISELVEDRLTLCKRIYLNSKSLKFDTSGLKANIFANVDANYLRQTVDNLIINAIKFSEEGKIKIILDEYYEDESDPNSGKVIFCIEDEGKGIPTNELYDIFVPFKIASNSESKANGRGVGLSLCKSAVEAHGGSIVAQSNGGIGAKFTFTLPNVKLQKESFGN